MFLLTSIKLTEGYRTQHSRYVCTGAYMLALRALVGQRPTGLGPHLKMNSGGYSHDWWSRWSLEHFIQAMNSARNSYNIMFFWKSFGRTIVATRSIPHQCSEHIARFASVNLMCWSYLKKKYQHIFPKQFDDLRTFSAAQSYNETSPWCHDDNWLSRQQISSKKHRTICNTFAIIIFRAFIS